MKKYLQDIRNEIYYTSWEKYKNRIDMDQLKEIFSEPISLKSLYRILAEVKKVDKNNK